MLKHPKPLNDEPSKELIKYFNTLKFIPIGPIADVACGYGRNRNIFYK